MNDGIVAPPVGPDAVSAANAAFWNEPCGTALARSIGITEITPESLEAFDQAYFAMYPYLRGYVDRLSIQGKRVLEIGVGYGTLGQYLARMAGSYRAVDIAEEPIGLVQQRLALLGRDPTAAVQGSALDLPFDDGSIDVVVSIGCLHHTGDLRKSVDEVHRVLAPGGAALVMVYNRDSLRRLMNVPRARLKRALGRPTAGDPDEVVRRMYDANLDGTAAPHTDFVSHGQAGRVFRSFRSVRIDRRNFDAYVLARRIVLDRRWFLGWADRLLGLDLYIVAVK